MQESNELSAYNTYDQLIELLKKSKKFDLEKIHKAYTFALKAHANQKRKSGLPYIVHPISVAYIIAELEIDTESIVASLLHDVVEDTKYSLKQIEKIFGSAVSNLIDGVTKIGKIKYSSREEAQAENLRKMLIAMADDIRVIIIKLADRLNNMRTIGCMSTKKQLEKSLENMEIYAPIAHRLGIRAIKEELEDISLRYLDPIAYKEIEQHLNMKKNDREFFIKKIKVLIKNRIEKIIPEVSISGRVKSINGIYRKVYMKNRNIDEIFDIYAVRVIVNTVNDCYNVLGIMHDIFRPIPNRFKDYISTPKPNMYQSLHTTVISKEGIPFEIQIRTWDMHHTAEYGIAAHWKYKLTGSSEKSNNSFEKHLDWIHELIENQEDSADLITTIKTDLLPEETYVFTPQSDVIVLPTGATVIDFAYAIHSEIGNKMIGAKVDGRIVPIDYKLKTGEIVNILTSGDNLSGPSRDWLKIVKTGTAKNKIRQWFKKEKREENIQEGKHIIDHQLKKFSMFLPEAETKKLLKTIASKYRKSSIESLYEAIGYGGIPVSKIILNLKEHISQIKKDKISPIKLFKEKLKFNKSKSNVIVDGIGNCLIKFAQCCHPIPGDEIIGFVTRGFGVSIHKKDCINVPKKLSSSNDERWINAKWSVNSKEGFNSKIEISATDRNNLLKDIMVKLSEMHVFTNSINAKQTNKSFAIIYADIIVNSVEHLNSIIKKLELIQGVIRVRRF